MMSKVTIVLVLQFGLPILAALILETMRPVPRSWSKRMLLGFASIVLSIIPLAFFGLIIGSAPHGAPVDWYIILCIASFGSVPVVVAAITYFATSSIIEPLIGMFRRSDVAERNQLELHGNRHTQDSAVAG